MKKPQIITTEKIILGIDPGTRQMGFGILSQEGKALRFVHMDVLNMTRLTDPALKLKKIFETTLQYIEEYKPDAVAIEAPFFGKNVQSMLKLGRAQGVAIAAAMVREVPIFEYAPRKIKLSITGKGSASKEQVAAMLGSIMTIDLVAKSLDATDALAAAACHAFQNDALILSQAPKVKKKSSSWETFVSQNADRIKKM